MSYKKKAASVLCAAAAIVMAAASAVTAFAFETVKKDARKDEITPGVVNIMADEVYAVPGEEVSYQVKIAENSGYAGIGVELYYDERLIPKTISDKQADLVREDAAYGMVCDQTINKAKNLIAFSGVSDTNTTAEGALYTVKFTVPSDANEGDKYPLTVKITNINDQNTDAVEYHTVDGWIMIRMNETTSVPATATNVKSETTLTGTETEKPNDTTASIQQTTVTSEVTGEIETDVSTVSSTKKTTRDPFKNVTTSANANGNNNNNNQQNNTNKGSNNNSKTEGVKTGDTGVAVVLAALLLAGSSAVVFGRRKKD